MAGAVKKIMPISRSFSVKDFVDFSGDFSIALEYTGSPINHDLPWSFPIDVDRIPTAKLAAPSSVLNTLSLTVVEPISRKNLRVSKAVRFIDAIDRNSPTDCDVKTDYALFNANRHEIESSGALGFSDSQEDNSNELSESSTPPFFPTQISCEEEEESDVEPLECRRNKRVSVEHEYRERRVAVRPEKRGQCYHCRKGNRFTEKESCIACDAKYCRRCILRAMGSMPEGRKCLGCIGFRVMESKRNLLGKSSRMLRRLFHESEVKQIMDSELSCDANQISPKSIYVNGSPLSWEELMELQGCENPPRNLKAARYWYDKSAGFWGKEGHKPCQMISPDLSIGGYWERIRPHASNGNTNVRFNGRLITTAELWIVKSAGIQCVGEPNFWVAPDGSYEEEGMGRVKGNIWRRKRTRLLCTLLSLPIPQSANSGKKSDKIVADGTLSRYHGHRTLCKILLVGNDQSGTSAIYKQARVLYDVPFSKEELENMKLMIQCALYGYLGRLLEGREQFEEESLTKMRRNSTDPGTSDTSNVIQEKTEYTIGPRLKVFSDWLINIMVSGNLDIVFPAATREYAPYVEELWKDAAIQATYSRKDELQLPRAARYFLDRAVEIAKVDYEPSDTDILYAEGISASNGLASMEFSTEKGGIKNREEHPEPITRYQLVRVDAKSLGEKCKWLGMFEDVGIVLFCVSLTEYDEYEANSRGVLVNKMWESKKLFESIVTQPIFEKTHFLLVLNKFDLLEEKIEQAPLTRCDWFADFNPVMSRHQSRGNALLAQHAFHYIAVKFKRLFTGKTGKKLYVCPVTALDSDTVDSAVRYVGDIAKWEEEEKHNLSLIESSSESIEQSSSLVIS